MSGVVWFVERAAAAGAGIFISATSGPGANCAVAFGGETGRGFAPLDCAFTMGCALRSLACVAAGAITFEEFAPVAAG